MSKADEMFNKLGMRRTLNNENTEIYRFKDDYYDFSVFFDKELKRFHYTCSAFIFTDRNAWEEMNKKKQFRDDFDKHCCKYGYWGGFPEYIDMQLLQAINEKCKELRVDRMNEIIGKRVVTYDGHIGIVIKRFKPTGRNMSVHIKQDDGRIWFCPETDIVDLGGNYE